MGKGEFSLFLFMNFFEFLGYLTIVRDTFRLNLNVENHVRLSKHKHFYRSKLL